jgi:hypothetical protein
MEFRWTPNKPLDARIPERMRAAFPMPSEPPPVAWFMSEVQRYFDSLAEEIAAKDDRALERYLFDTATGIKSFGQFDIWTEWYRYMLPTVIELCFARADLVQHAMGYSFNAYPDGIPEEYPGFRADVLGSLGQVVMSGIWWASPDILKEYYEDPKFRYNRKGHMYSNMPEVGWTSDLNSSMFFCLKYLHVDEIAVWVDSIAAIDTPEWRGAIRQWLDAFQTMQHLLENPSEIATYQQKPPFHDLYGEPDQSEYVDEDYTSAKYIDTADYLTNITNLSWDWSQMTFSSRSLKILKTFFPSDNLAAFWDAVERHDWLREAVTGDPK